MRLHFLQHVPFETPGHLLTWAEEQGHATGFTRIFAKEAFPELKDMDALVIMGGPMGVYQERQYPWLAAEKAFIRSAIEEGKKVLGICLGAQLIAAALGARVYPGKEKEIGWFPVQKTARGQTDAWFSGWPEALTAFHWHGDTFDLPPGAVHLLHSDACAHQAFSYRDRVLGLQFHMEIEPDGVAALVETDGAQLTPAAHVQSAKTILSEQRYFAPNQRLLDGLLGAFL